MRGAMSAPPLHNLKLQELLEQTQAVHTFTILHATNAIFVGTGRPQTIGGMCVVAPRGRGAARGVPGRARAVRVLADPQVRTAAGALDGDSAAPWAIMLFRPCCCSMVKRWRRIGEGVVQVAMKDIQTYSGRELLPPCHGMHR